MEKNMNDICEIKNRLISFVQTSALDLCNVEVNGAITDMIKDLSEAEEKCWKACYYKKIVEAMEEEKKEGRRYGYDNWRYPSSGRFAETGKGVRMGHHPMIEDDYMMFEDGFYGYRGDGGQNERSSSNDGSSGNRRYGYPMDSYAMDGMSNKAYDRYKNARRHYHESNDPNAKNEMDQHAKEHVHEVEESVKDIWKTASPELRKKMKMDLTNLANGLQA